MKNIFKILTIITVGLVVGVNSAMAGGKMPKYANNYVKFIKQFKTIIEIDYNAKTQKKKIKRYNKYFKVSVIKESYNYYPQTGLYDLMIRLKGKNLNLYIDVDIDKRLYKTPYIVNKVVHTCYNHGKNSQHITTIEASEIDTFN